MLLSQSCTRACKGKVALLARSHGFQSLHKPTSTGGEQAPVKVESLIRKHVVSDPANWKQKPQKKPFFSSNTASPRPNVKKRPPRKRTENNGLKEKVDLRKPATPNGPPAVTALPEGSLESEYGSGSPRMPRRPPGSGAAIDKASHARMAGSVKSHGGQDQRTQELTHFEELFPFEAAQERARKAQARILTQTPQDQMPSHHRPLEFSHVESTDHALASMDDEEPSALTQPSSSSSSPPISTQPSQRLSLDPLVAVMLVLHTASTSLSEADFRRIAPKGKHIKEWTGPGELLKVFPGRDPRTLQQLPHYFLLFRNIEHARIYRDHVRELHEKAKERMPTSIESPLTLPRLGPQPSLGDEGGSSGSNSNRSGDEHGIGEEEDRQQKVEEEPSDPNSLLYNADDPVISALHDYALIPPSQTLELTTLKAPFSASQARLLHNEGYADITRAGRDGEDRTGRAVLFYAEGCKEFKLEMIRQALAVDNWQRGMVWQCVIHKIGWNDEVAPQEYDEGPATLSDMTGDEMQGPAGAGMNRWILTFKEKEDARRFVRRWHLRAFPMGEGEEDVNVSAEILW